MSTGQILMIPDRLFEKVGPAEILFPF